MGDNVGEPLKTRKEYSNWLEKNQAVTSLRRNSVIDKKRLLPKSVSIDSQVSRVSNEENLNFQNELVII